MSKRSSLDLVKQSAVSFFNVHPTKLYFTLEGHKSPCAEIAVIFKPCNGKFSSFIYVKMSARHANLWIHTMSHM
jgi:hypothetical protein